MYKYILSFLFLIFVTVSSYAQITINSNGDAFIAGNTSVGLSTASSNKKINIECSNNTNCSGSIRYGTYSYVKDAISIGYGVYGSAYGVNSGVNNAYGVYGNAANGYGSAGVFGRSTGGSYGYGIYGKATGASVTNYGVRGEASGSNDYGGYFTQGIYVSGGITQASDERLKKNIRALNNEDVFVKIRQLKPKRYEFLTENELKQRGLPTSHAVEGGHFGLLAQDLEEIFPELVTDVVHVLKDENGKIGKNTKTVTTKAINYQELTVVLLAAVQELQARVEVLEAELNKKID